MSAARSSPERAPRALRADAQRNRDAILVAARETFEEEGVLASLDGIAVRAGVGNATLYRNFPTRDDLLAAVMEANIEAALAEAEALSGSLGPREALAEWLLRLTWQLRIWHDLPYCVASARSDPESSMNPASTRLIEKTRVLLDEAKSAGMAVKTVTAEDLFELVTTLSWGVDRFGDDEQAARRRVAIATAGIFTMHEVPSALSPRRRR
ncbi:helix-turn-helix domain containing protein [Caballeronia sp. LjRoot29]|uniref:TetR/AcrR family transcriptional regulator n=1 Tax=Caballeronia sp. LjRoot29 TaxID=3342315 RepID=UPI003ECFC356